MKKNLPSLRICMFGKTVITYGNKPIPFGKKSITKVQKLLMIMCYCGVEGIARNKLLEDLYERESVLDAANNLRVTAHRLEQKILEAGLPKHDYIKVEDGIYRLSSPVELEIDAVIFKENIAQAGQAKERKEKSRLLMAACELYRGEFLEDFSDMEWVLLEGARLKKLYEESMFWLCGYLKEQEAYEEVIRLCKLACKIYPFDEWQACVMECYMAQGRFQDAYREYKDTERLLIEELGVTPSKRMLKLLEALRERMSGTPIFIDEIRERLKETESVDGAYYCSLPSFRDEYRFACRIMERSPMDMYLMLCTITNEKGYPQEDAEILGIIAKKLHSVIKQSLRRCDTFTRFSPSQFLILLPGADKDSCTVVNERISKQFRGEYKTYRSSLQWDAFPVEGNEEPAENAGKRVWRV